MVEHLRRGRSVRDVSFDAPPRRSARARPGLVGAGRTETARLLFGADRRDAGTIALDGQRAAFAQPRDAIRAGIAC